MEPGITACMLTDNLPDSLLIPVRYAVVDEIGK